MEGCEIPCNIKEMILSQALVALPTLPTDSAHCFANKTFQKVIQGGVFKSEG